MSSVNERHAELKSARVHTHHLRRHRRHAFLGLVASLAAAGGLLFLIMQSIVSVTAVSAGTNGFVPDPYQQKIHEYLTKHPLERFRMSVNQRSLTGYLQSNGMPEVEAVSLADPQSVGIANAQFFVRLRKPVVVWQSGATRTYVDANGASFERSFFGEPGVQVVDQTGIQAQNNQVLASQHFLGFIGKVIGQMQKNGYKVTEIILPANTTRQLQVKLEGVSYAIKFSIDRPAGEQAEDAARSVKYITGKGMKPEYLDVRVSGKAYYK